MVIRDIPGLDGYQCSDTGIVYRLTSSGDRREKSTFTHHGYVMTRIRGRTYSVHRLVLLTFVGPCPEGHQACHYDGDRQNNALCNLRYDTPKANAADKRRHGRQPSKLTPESVVFARNALARGMSATWVADVLNITRTSVWNAVSRRTWEHV